jgi:1,4-dihydroxy-2-naphthoyl-CoA hydrolase
MTAPKLPDVSLDAAPAFLRQAGLQVQEATPTRVTGTIVAGPDHHTPWGVVHGGVYTTAVESACSIGASLAVIDCGEFAVGLANQTDFLRPFVEGELRVTATPIQQGRTQQLWQCEIARPDGKLVARGQLRLQNVPLRDGDGSRGPGVA